MNAAAVADGAKYTGSHRMQMGTLPLEFAGMILTDYMAKRPSNWPSLAPIAVGTPLAEMPNVVGASLLVLVREANANLSVAVGAQFIFFSHQFSCRSTCKRCRPFACSRCTPTMI